MREPAGAETLPLRCLFALTASRHSCTGQNDNNKIPEKKDPLNRRCHLPPPPSRFFRPKIRVRSRDSPAV
jgi:hypothetical protein